MKVKRTLHEVFSELTELGKMRENTAHMVAHSSANDNSDGVKYYTDEYKHFDEVIKYLSKIEVEYEDKYETEDE